MQYVISSALLSISAFFLCRQSLISETHKYKYCQRPSENIIFIDNNRGRFVEKDEGITICYRRGLFDYYSPLVYSTNRQTSLGSCTHSSSSESKIKPKVNHLADTLVYKKTKKTSNLESIREIEYKPKSLSVDPWTRSKERRQAYRSSPSTSNQSNL